MKICSLSAHFFPPFPNCSIFLGVLLLKKMFKCEFFSLRWGYQTSSERQSIGHILVSVIHEQWKNFLEIWSFRACELKRNLELESFIVESFRALELESFRTSYNALLSYIDWSLAFLTSDDFIRCNEIIRTKWPIYVVINHFVLMI